MKTSLTIEEFLRNLTPSTTFTIYCDGACSGNPGPGGWGGIILRLDEKLEFLVSGYEEATTNNRMEMTAAIKSLSLLPKGSTIEVYSDSQYLRDGITSWMKKWKTNGWKNYKKEPVKNQDLWEELDELNTLHTVSWHWVKGHSTSILNNRVDMLARQAIVAYSMRK